MADNMKKFNNECILTTYNEQLKQVYLANIFSNCKKAKMQKIVSPHVPWRLVKF